MTDEVKEARWVYIPEDPPPKRSDLIATKVAKAVRDDGRKYIGSGEDALAS